ncbi:MAG: DUF192 domain-containing protein [Pseudoxanthomonas suwonensis]|nr:DUF192 domain-containing protein [Pseudoxanthomonas suwonensis]
MKTGSIRCAASGQTIAAHAWLADRWPLRLRGLLGRAPLQDRARQALWLRPCASVHTLGMRYALDVVFLDRDDRVCGWREHLAPIRFAACTGARSTVEFHAGALDVIGPRLGSKWDWQPQQEQRK